MEREEFERLEHEAKDIIGAIERASASIDVPSGLGERVMARIEGEEAEAFERLERKSEDDVRITERASDNIDVPSDLAERSKAGTNEEDGAIPTSLRWRTAVVARVSSWWPSVFVLKPVRIAMACVLAVALAGAIPQYMIWFDGLTRLSPPIDSDSMYTHEQYWKANLSCSEELSVNDQRYKLIASNSSLDNRQWRIYSWNCPDTGDMQVTLEVNGSTIYALWIPPDKPMSSASLWHLIIGKASASAQVLEESWQTVSISQVLCQVWQGEHIVRLVMLDDRVTCMREWIDPSTGRIVGRTSASCNEGC